MLMKALLSFPFFFLQPFFKPFSQVYPKPSAMRYWQEQKILNFISVSKQRTALLAASSKSFFLGVMVLPTKYHDKNVQGMFLFHVSSIVAHLSSQPHALLVSSLRLDWDRIVSIAHVIPIRTKSNKRAARHVLMILTLSHWAPNHWLSVEVILVVQ